MNMALWYPLVPVLAGLLLGVAGIAYVAAGLQAVILGRLQEATPDKRIAGGNTCENVSTFRQGVGFDGIRP